MANRHMKRCATLLVIREMQVKTIMRYHFTPVRMATIKHQEITKHKCWREHGEGNSLTFGGNVNCYSRYGDQYAAAAAKSL